MAGGQFSREAIGAAIAKKNAQLRRQIDGLQRQLAELQAFDAGLAQIPDACFHL